MKNTFKIVFSVIVGLILIFGCGIKAPVEDLEKAKQNLSQLEKIEAQQFASEDYNEVQKLILAGETNMVTNKKSSKNKKAKKYLEEANAKATNTFKKVAPLFADHYIKKSDTSLNKAKEIKADVAVKDEYQKGEILIKEAKELLKKGEYVLAGEKAKEASKIFEEAYLKAKEKKEKAESAIKEAENKLMELQK